MSKASRISLLASAGAISLALLGLYFITLAPTVTLVDSGELILAAHSLGVAHPPGFPLYVLLSHLATLFPIGNVAQRVNFVSSLFAALAASATCLAAYEILAVNQTILKQRWNIALVLYSGLLFGFSRTLWAYATVSEVYTLNIFLVTLIVALLLRWRRLSFTENTNLGDSKKPACCDGKSDWLLYFAAFFFGLALGVHHVTVALILPACAILVIATTGIKFIFSRRFIYSAAFAIIGLGIYLYLPLAAMRKPLMNWGDPSTLDHFVAHVTGKQYLVYFSLQLESIMHELGDFLFRLLNEFDPPKSQLVIILSLIGLIYLYRHARSVFWFLLVGIASNLAYNTSYQIAEDKDAYYLPVYFFLVLASTCGMFSVVVWIDRQSLLTAKLITTVFAAFLIMLAITFYSNYRWNDRSNFYVAEDYARNIMSTVSPTGMLITTDWQVYSPTLYLHEVEKFRKDAVIIDINQLRRSWYFEYLEHSYPDTMQAARTQIDDFLEDLRNWERNPELYQSIEMLNQRISRRFKDLIIAFIRNHQNTAPVYITADIATQRIDSVDSEWVQEVLHKYQLLPQGLVFELVNDREFHEPSQPILMTRGLIDGSLRFAPDDVVTKKILPVYAGMTYSRGRYLEAAGRREEAKKLFREALVFLPDFLPAKMALEAN